MHVRQKMWIHNLLIVSNQSPHDNIQEVILCESEDCNLWLSGVTMHGKYAYDPTFGALNFRGGQLYAEGVHAHMYPLPNVD